MTGPGRIQLSRRKGWRMQPGAVKVARPGPWGNPFPLADDDRPEPERRAEAVARFRAWHAGVGPDEIQTGARVYSRRWQREHLRTIATASAVACWCPLDEECHGDALVEMAVEGNHGGDD